MESIGILRKIDDLGRVVIPVEVRNKCGWAPGSMIEFHATDEGAFVKAHKVDKDKENLIEALESIKLHPTNYGGVDTIIKAIDYIKGH